MPTVMLDDRTCAAQVDETILAVARRHDVWIPTLCYHPALEPYAACRLCMVELDRGGWSQMVTACNYPVRRDLRVQVNSPRAVRARHGVMRLLLARAPESAELLELAARMGVEGTEFPTVTHAERNCILCGLCVHACAERIGVAAIALSGRGVERKVATPFNEPSPDCILCGACAAVCPVGTISLEVHGDEVELKPFGTRGPLQRCDACGRGLVTDTVLRALQQRGGPAVAQVLLTKQLCSVCKRERLAGQLAMVSPGGQPVGRP